MLADAQAGEFRDEVSQYVHLIFKLFSKKKSVHVVYYFMYTHNTGRGLERGSKTEGGREQGGKCSEVLDLNKEYAVVMVLILRLFGRLENL